MPETKTFIEDTSQFGTSLSRQIFLGVLALPGLAIMALATFGLAYYAFKVGEWWFIASPFFWGGLYVIWFTLSTFIFTWIDQLLIKKTVTQRLNVKSTFMVIRGYKHRQRGLLPGTTITQGQLFNGPCRYFLRPQGWAWFSLVISASMFAHLQPGSEVEAEYYPLSKHVKKLTLIRGGKTVTNEMDELLAVAYPTRLRMFFIFGFGFFIWAGLVAYFFK